MSTVTIDPAADVATLLAMFAERGELELESDGVVVARLLPARQRAPYVGLYGNHPYQQAARHEVHLPDLGPDDFED